MTQRADTAEPARDGAPAAPTSGRGRLWLFRSLALLLPLLALCLLEVALRIAGYGYSTSFFQTIRWNGQKVVVPNENFSLRFFAPELARWPSAFSFSKAKPPGVCRIFIFGESAAMGDPQPVFGAGRYMEVLLKERFPDRKFEVINTGVTAINSHVILPIARDCAAQHGDIWIIYMGNNEMVGPFGAGAMFGSRAPPRSVVRLMLGIQATRVGQLFKAATRRLAGGSDNRSWGGMEMFLRSRLPPGDPRKEIVYRNFDANLRDIVQIGLDSGANVILNTMAVNLKDCPPLASLGSSNLPAADRQRFESLYAEGVSLEKQGSPAEAARTFEQAAQIDASFAELQFRWADCLLRLTNSAARQHFQLARDDDALPFRADSRINALIRQVAERPAERRLVLCDAEAALQAHSPDRIPGAESFFEHVHFRPEGNYVLGRLWADQVERLLPDTRANSAPLDWASREVCDRQLGLSLWNRVQVLDSVLARMNQPPLSSQLNNVARREELEREARELREREAGPGAVAAAREEFEAAIRRWPSNPNLHENYARFLESVGDTKQAIIGYQKVAQQMPRNFNSSLQLGRLLGEQGQLAEAQTLLRDSVKARPSVPEAWSNLGNVTFAEGKFAEALDCYDRAARLRPRDAAYLCLQAKALLKLNRREEAIAQFELALRLEPTNKVVQDSLDQVRAPKGQKH